MPFEELRHSADWCLRVWAADLPSLFAEAARGLNALAGVQLAEAPPLERTLDLPPADAESLLVAFLSELVYAAEREQTAYDRFEIRLPDGGLQARMGGAPLLGLQKPIKAVTYHNLEIRPRPEGGYQVEIVFDV